MTTFRKLKAKWTGELEQDFANFHGNMSLIPPGEDYLEQGTTFYYYTPEHLYVVLETSPHDHLIYSFSDENKFYHPGGIDVNLITIVKDENDRA